MKHATLAAAALLAAAAGLAGCGERDPAAPDAAVLGGSSADAPDAAASAAPADDSDLAIPPPHAARGGPAGLGARRQRHRVRRCGARRPRGACVVPARLRLERARRPLEQDLGARPATCGWRPTGPVHAMFAVAPPIPVGSGGERGGLRTASTRGRRLVGPYVVPGALAWRPQATGRRRRRCAPAGDGRAGQRDGALAERLRSRGGAGRALPGRRGLVARRQRAAGGRAGGFRARAIAARHRRCAPVGAVLPQPRGAADRNAGPGVQTGLVVSAEVRCRNAICGRAPPGPRRARNRKLPGAPWSATAAKARRAPSKPCRSWRSAGWTADPPNRRRRTIRSRPSGRGAARGSGQSPAGSAESPSRCTHGWPRSSRGRPGTRAHRQQLLRVEQCAHGATVHPSICC